MPLDFPNSPTVGATYTGPSGVVWTYDGAKWASGSGATAPTFNDVGRNLIHNPLFNIAQRGTAAATTNGAWPVDRWQVSLSLDTASFTQVAFSDANRAQIGDEAATFALANSFAGNAGAGAFNRIIHRIEDVRRLAGKTVTVSFWAAAGAGTPKLGVNVNQLFGTGGSPSATISVVGQAAALTTVYTRYSLTFVVPSVASKVLGTANDHSTELSVWFSAGASQAVNAGNIGVQSGTVSLWGVQLEVGSVATPLEKPDPRYDLANCQRFYCTAQCVIQGYGVTGASAGQTLTLPVTMRASPTLAATSNANANLGALTLNSLGAGMFAWLSRSGNGDRSVDRQPKFHRQCRPLRTPWQRNTNS